MGNGGGINVRGHDFAPADHSLTMFMYDFLHFLDKIVEIILFGGMALIPTCMKIRPGRNFGNLAHDVIDKGIYGVFSGIERAETYVRAFIRFDFFTVAV